MIEQLIDFASRHRLLSISQFKPLNLMQIFGKIS